MAAQIASSAPGLPGADQEINAAFLSSFRDITEQFENGIVAPTVSLTKISTRGEKGFNLFKQCIEVACNTSFQFTIDAAADAVTLIPLGPMLSKTATSSMGSLATNHVGDAIHSPEVSATTYASTTTSASPPTTGSAGRKRSSEDKVPRPPNAFIIYRKEWHPKVVKEHPSMHNNDVSKVIGRKWAAEPQAVKDEYKRKAEDAKRQHAIDHPGYQYQPRKPGARAKRMTKNKLAKLRSQANAAVAPDPMNELNEMLTQTANDKHVTVDTFQAPYSQGFPNLQPSQEANNHLTFDAGSEEEQLLYSQLVGWNAANPRPAGVVSEPAVLGGRPSADGQTIVPQHEEPYSFTYVDYADEWSAHGSANAASATAAFHDATAEVERQGRIYDDAFGELFNFEACADPVVEGDGAEGALQDFQGSYELAFEQSSSFHI